ncbi:ABC transporter substrate-binding protein [Photobacterium indicum]|uniref:ABC transporter substrate-binding protein n=1 Tax=Photobacterium indicum TaxID=81447 RepID=UPI003D0A89E0
MFFRALGFLVACLSSVNSNASQVEVLHWWSSEGEQLALNELRLELERQDIMWSDSVVPGGGGDTATSVLQARAIAGNPPGMAQIDGAGIKSWAKLGFLADLDSIAKKHKWRERLPKIAVDINTYRGSFVSAPINIHRVNWLWSNKAVLSRYNLTPPDSWSAFFDVAETLKSHGVTPLAVGNEPWQLGIIFEVMALGLHGTDYYRALLMDFDLDVISSVQTRTLLSTFRRVKPYTRVITTSMAWDVVMASMVSGEVAMQLQGDWVKGELTAQGLEPGKDYLCSAAPGTSNAFIYNMDSLVLFRLRSNESEQMVNQLAATLVSPDFQSKFNQKKGSIPVLRDVDMSAFDSCSKAANQQFEYAGKHQSLLPSMSDSMATSLPLQEAMLDLIALYFNDDTMTEEQAISQLIKIARSKRFEK